MSVRCRGLCGGRHGVGVVHVDACASHAGNDRMASGTGADGAEVPLCIVLDGRQAGRERRGGGEAGDASRAGRLDDPACLEGEAVLVERVELVAAVGHVGHLPATCAVVHADLGVAYDAAFFHLARAYDADDFAGAPALVVRLVVVVGVAIVGGLDDEQVVVAQALAGVEGAGEAAGRGRGQQREGDNLVDGLGALGGEDLVQLQLDLGADVQLGARVDGGRRVGDDVRRLGARRLLGALLVGDCAAA